MANRIEDFRAALRSAVRGLWSGALSLAEFYDIWDESLDRYLTFAWAEGAERYGISSEDYTQDDINARDQFILNQQNAAEQLGLDIVEKNKVHGGDLEKILSRVNIWVLRYDELVSIARMTYAKDEKLRWTINPEKDHCHTCLPLNGWVKRASYWQKFYSDTGIRPKSESLACHGIWCGCELKPTGLPISKGRPPVNL